MDLELEPALIEMNEVTVVVEAADKNIRESEMSVVPIPNQT